VKQLGVVGAVLVILAALAVPFAASGQEVPPQPAGPPEQLPAGQPFTAFECVPFPNHLDAPSPGATYYDKSTYSALFRIEGGVDVETGVRIPFAHDGVRDGCKTTWISDDYEKALLPGVYHYVSWPEGHNDGHKGHRGPSAGARR
jgi:hypothetical protein